MIIYSYSSPDDCPHSVSSSPNYPEGVEALIHISQWNVDKSNRATGTCACIVSILDSVSTAIIYYNNYSHYRFTNIWLYM